MTFSSDLIMQQNPNWLRGIDVSRWQGKIDWNAVSDSGISFAYIKATEGKSLIDQNFASNWAGACNTGTIARGAYHFMTTATPADKQAVHFLAVYPGYGELPPVLDLERGANGLEPEAEAALVWLELVEHETGIRPIVYCSPGYAISKLQSPVGKKLGDYPLYVAHYGVMSPAIRAPWTDWKIWQPGTGIVPGIKGNVDLDFMKPGE